MRRLQIKVIIAENVVQFGLSPYQDELGDLYVCIRVVVSAHAQGWATERVRQIVFMFYKPWIFTLMRASEIPASLGSLHEHLAIHRVLAAVFERRCAFGWDQYLVANQEELEKELAWARGRKEVKRRREEAGFAETGLLLVVLST